MQSKVDIDLLLYLAMGLISAMLVSFTSDTAYKYVNNDRLWWYVQFLLWSQIVITHWKAYRSNTHATRTLHKAEMDIIAKETSGPKPGDLPAPAR